MKEDFFKLAKRGEDMRINRFFFQLEDQWNVVYLPYRPNGFAIFLLTEHEKAVEKDTSIWEQHPERHLFLQKLLDQGYTIFTSELFGRHWGSKRACDYTERLYHFIIKNYILNQK